MNKILAWFGLMKINRAEIISARIHVFYVQCVLDGIEKDFGRPSHSEAIKNTEKWWRNEFRQTLKHNSNDINITTEATFNNLTI